MIAVFPGGLRHLQSAGVIVAYVVGYSALTNFNIFARILIV